MEREVKRVKNGAYVLIPRSDDTNGHVSYYIGKLYTKYLADLLATQ